MSIYTKTGDQGQTSLASGVRVSKSDGRIEAYGTADELNAYVGWLRSLIQSDEANRFMDDWLEWIQNKLFNLGAALADAPGEWMRATDVQQLEQWIDTMQAALPVARGFILPGGTQIMSLGHVCRTVTRRLERQIVAMQQPDSSVEKSRCNLILQFVNRLSDFWFLFSNTCGKNAGIENILWKK